MIVFEDVIDELVRQMPEIQGFKPTFHWGDEFELNKYILRTKGKAYPLIWLNVDTEDHSINEVTRDCRFILAVQDTDHKDQLNDVRINKSYKDALNPLAELFIFGLNKFHRTTLVNNEFRLRKFPNYSDSGKHKTVDRWDALTIDCTILMNNHCNNTILWPTR